MLHEEIWEVPLYIVKIFFVPKTYVVYLVCRIKSEIVFFQKRHYIAVGMVRDVKIARHPVNFEETFEVASLFLL
jgi:hypothetical protein